MEASQPSLLQAISKEQELILSPLGAPFSALPLGHVLPFPLPWAMKQKQYTAQQRYGAWHEPYLDVHKTSQHQSLIPTCHSATM